MGRRLTQKAVLIAIEGSGGSVTEIAKRLGCTRNTVSGWVSRDPEIAEALEAERIKIVEDAVRALAKAVLEGAPWAIARALNSKRGRALGWGDSPRLEVTGADGGPIQEELTIRPVDYRSGLQAIAPGDGE